MAHELPEDGKLYFTIGEVSRLAGVKPHVLRFWEQEFPSLAPKKDEAGRRVYRRRDVETVLQIRHLLYDEKFTIPGARRALMAEGLEPPDPLTTDTLKRELGVVLNILREGAASSGSAERPDPPPAGPGRGSEPTRSGDGSEKQAGARILRVPGGRFKNT